MNIGSVVPLTSRSRFRSRTPDTIIFLVALFIPAIAISSVVSVITGLAEVGMFVCDALAVGAALYFYNILRDRPIRLRCPSCARVVLSNTPWICGVCKQPNLNANQHPFVEQCGHCGGEPKAYKCHHCEQLIFLSDDHDQRNYAFSLNSPKDFSDSEKRAKRAQSKREKIEVKELQISEKQQQILMAQLDARRKEIKAQVQGKVAKTLEGRKAQVAKMVESGTAVLRAAREQKAKHAAEITSREERLRANRLVDDWQQRELAKGDEENV